MSVYDIGRVCVKTMGREAARYCIIVDVIDKNYLLVDGTKVKRRRCNYKHLEPIDKMIDIEKGASHEDVIAAIKSAKIEDLMNEMVEIPTQ
ncbi:MAG: 50S ribosomal protein L14e [Promethearchaeota archaeon]|nr:MAG: 50S ribosomal protein L14e [Candidatus Lokiarchaeota archaeon]